MQALKDATTGQFISVDFGTNEGDEWYEENSADTVSVYELAASNDDDFTSFDEDLDDTFWSSLALGSDYDYDDDLLQSPEDIEKWVHARYSDVIGQNDALGFRRLSVEQTEEALPHPAFYSRNRTNIRSQNESELCARFFRKYRNKRKDCGKKRPASWQRAAGTHRQRHSVRFVSPQIAHRLTAHEYLDGFLN